MSVNLKLDLTYDGTAYSGFQWQKQVDTIQGCLEEALDTLYKQKIRIAGAGRTDAGVHARGQVVTYTAPALIPPIKVPLALNSLLPEDIVVTAAAVVPDNFHARFSARRKIYSYNLDLGRYPRVMLRRYTYHHPEALDVIEIQEAATLFEGKHDFRAFRARGSAVRRTERTLNHIFVDYKCDEELLSIIFEGEGFLYKMVRMIAGTLLRVGRDEITREAVALALRGENPAAVGPTAPARGLCLEKVIY